jgi:hypothetical protein
VCLHFARGREIRSEGALAQVRDMVSVIDRHEIDWEMFVANANRYRAAGRTFLALFTLAELGFAPPPGPFLALRPRGFDGFTGRQFIRERVLTSEPCVPTRTWNLSIEGVRGTLWWGRRNLASREDVPPEAARPLLSRRRALVRLVGHTLRHPRRVLHDMRISKWIERSV